MTPTVLLVDDDAEVLHALARMLQKQPYQLYTARSAEEAIAMLKARQVDVIVADECMPRMSGAALLAWVADSYPDMVRMMLTGYASVETLIRAVNEGGVSCVFTKPCNEAHLAIAICKALEHKQALKKEAELREAGRQQAQQRQHFVKDLEVLERLISRDLHQPLHTVAQSCQSLLEQDRELFDPQARSLLEGTLEAIADMQWLVADVQARLRAGETAGNERPAGIEPQAPEPRAP